MIRIPMVAAALVLALSALPAKAEGRGFGGGSVGSTGGAFIGGNALVPDTAFGTRLNRPGPGQRSGALTFGRGNIAGPGQIGSRLRQRIRRPQSFDRGNRFGGGSRDYGRPRCRTGLFGRVVNARACGASRLKPSLRSRY